VIFGLRVEDIDRIKYSYSAKEYYDNDIRIRKVMDTFTDAVWSDNPDDFRLIYNELMTKNDEFFVLADFDAYVKAQEKIEELYQDRHQWAKMCLINIAKSGYFSSDRTIEQYVKDIWKVKKLKV
jgi:Glucan phosphorylase